MMGAPQHVPQSIVHSERVQTKLPRRFGRYRLVKRLGRGAMGTVYLVHDTALGRQVALKVPHFRSEEDGAATGASGSGPFLPRGPRRGDPGPSQSLPGVRRRSDRRNPLSGHGVYQGSASFALHQAQPPDDAAAGSSHRTPASPGAARRLISQGVVHRDLKPSNIMVNARRDLIIMDFGLVWRIGAQDERLTRVGLVLGTPAYMSPEQICGRAEGLGPSCDIYSLGVILYELLTGCVPFEGPEAFVLGQIVFAEPAPPSKHRPDLDPLIEAICLRAMAKKVEERYASMQELAKALEALPAIPLQG